MSTEELVQELTAAQQRAERRQPLRTSACRVIVQKLVAFAVLIGIVGGFILNTTADQTVANWETVKLDDNGNGVGTLVYMVNYCGTSMPWGYSLAVWKYSSKHPQEFTASYNKMRDDLSSPLAAGLAVLMCPVIQHWANERSSINQPIFSSPTARQQSQPTFEELQERELARRNRQGQ